MIVSKFAIVAEDLVICCYQVTIICGSRHSCRQCVFCTEPLQCWSFYRSRNFGFTQVNINAVLTKSTLLVVSSPTKFSLNSCSHSWISEYNGSHRSKSWSSLIFGFEFWVGLVNGSLRSFLSTHSLDTDAGSESITHKSSLALVSLSLDTIMFVDVEERKLEKELVDKPRTTIGKSSVLHCIRIPFVE